MFSLEKPQDWRRVSELDVGAGAGYSCYLSPDFGTIITEWQTLLPAAAGTGLVIYLLGLPVTYDIIFLELYDGFVDAIVFVFGALLVMILVGWIAPQAAIDELEKGMGSFGSYAQAWVWAIRVPIIVRSCR